MNSAEWLAYYRQNRSDRLPIAWDVPVQITPALRASVLRSLARFQLGESSAGTSLRRAARTTGDADFMAAIELFIAEEQEHARLLGRVLARFAVPPLHHHWSDWLFRRCRHRLGFSGEITVLLMAEIVALKYYSVVRTGTADGALRGVCDQMLHDEKFHVRFHCEYLHRWLGRRSPVVQPLASWVFTVLFAGATTVVAWDHRSAFLALGSSADEFLNDSWQNFQAAQTAILTGRPFVWSRTLGRAEAGPAWVAPRSEFQQAWALARQSARWLWTLSFQPLVLAGPARH
ncbi:MAG: hypothetical protein PCFJNLEI_00855 [Verrucomicrobiae bacterium]|nr:hypothetical protein [Verrucomicrobiae bacterium]